MPHFKLDPQHSSSWTQRILDRFRLRQGTYQIPRLEAYNGEMVHLDTLVPEDADLPAPLEPLALYMVRQTCQTLRELTNDMEFEDFQRHILFFEEETWRITPSTCDQLRLIKRIFLRRSLCEPCGNLFSLGELETRLRRLWQPIRCAGCNQNHPELLFPQGKEKGNICVGLLGHFALCKHVKVSAKLQPNCKDEMDIHCTDPEHYVASSKDAEQSSAVTRCHPIIRTSCLEGIHAIDYFRSFPMVKINQRRFPGMPALQAYLLKQLKEKGVEGLCQHASTQIDSIVSCMISDECNCFPASGTPVHKREAPYGPKARCPNHGYNCRHCGARYFWFYEGDYIVLRLVMLSRNTGPDSFGWLSNLIFDTDEHPIFNDNTKSVLWCDDPSCGTGCGNRWLLMVEILKRTSLRRYGGYHQVPPRDRYSVLSLPFILEYQVFQDAA
ncbi:hypothetical protein QSH57_016404 [Fusarium oxysporum f. sp. vasinfectum]|nr:hypothetical protein QSH57_016404 [Fusarium oxysporum f. sp. vasinfectum]